MFQLFTGPFREIESSFLADLIAQRKSDPLSSLLVVAPSGRLVTHLQTRLLECRVGFLNIHFLDFQRLATRIMEEEDPGEGRVAREPALVREILNDFLEGREDIPFLSRRELIRPGQPVPKGLPGALASTLKDLQDSGARVVDLAQVARDGHLGEAEEDAIPILELNVLLYDVLRKKGLRVNADLLRRAAERVSQSAWIQSLKGLFIYGFYDLTGVQLELLLALASHPDARVYFPYEEGNPAYAYAEKLLKDPAFASKTSSDGGGETGEGRKHSSPITHHPSPLTEVWSCSGARDEVWIAAKKMLELARQGVAYDQMCLTARSLEPYLGVIREVLEAHRIPYSLHMEELVGAWPIIKNARAALRGAPGRPDDRWSAHIAFAIHHLERTSKRLLDLNETEGKLWQGFVDALEALKELDVLERPVAWSRFLEVAEEKLEALRLLLAPDNNQGVQVLDVMGARGLSFGAVFLIGLNEKLFPRLIREDPFLSDAARSGLAEAIGCRIPRKLDGYQEERLLFTLATGLAREHLHLSFQRSDEEGKALVTSLYLQEFMERQGLTPKRLSRAWFDRIREVSPETLTPKEISLVMNREGRDTSALYDRLGWDKALYSQLLRSQGEIEAFGALGSHDGLIGDKHPAALTILREGLSPATLKDLAECPFKIFARKVLSLDPEESPVEGGVATRAGMGTLIHEILERFYRGGMKDLKRVSEEVFRRFEKENPDLYRLPWTAVKDRTLALLQQFVEADRNELNENGFVPTGFEAALSAKMDFGGKVLIRGRIDRLDLRQGAHPAFRVVDYKTGKGGLKKGQKIETAILKGEVFQLPIYLRLAQEWAREKGLPAKIEGTAVFYNLEKADTVEEPIEISSTFWEECGTQFNKNMKFLVKDIEKGYFYIRPSDFRGYCSWCHFEALCRKAHKPTSTRSENSPRRAAHEEVFSGQ
jgi:ATP-dependent helicase/DNAse subunit B